VTPTWVSTTWLSCKRGREMKQVADEMAGRIQRLLQLVAPPRVELGTNGL
jgi:hypothetical protein